MKYLAVFMLVISALGGCKRGDDNPVVRRTDRDIIYHITHVYEGADFNYPLMDEYRRTPSKWCERELVLEMFEPVDGPYRIILFTTVVWGYSLVDEQEHLFHHILLIKVDPDNTILDGLQYTLEWAECPLAYDICVLKAQGTKLTKELKLSEIEVESFLTGYDSFAPYYCEESKIGVLDNVYDFKEQF